MPAAAAKSLQSCPTLCHPIDGSPPGSPVPEILQARTLEWVAISFSNAWKWKVKVKSLSRVWLFPTPWTAAYQASLSMGFSRQEYWNGLLLPSLQYASKYGKFSSGHRTGKGQLSLQSPKRTMPKNVQTLVQLPSFHMLAKLCSKSFKLGFSSTWTKNFQMYKLVLQKPEEPEIKLPTSDGSYKKQRNLKKIYFCFTDYAKTFDC